MLLRRLVIPALRQQGGSIGSGGRPPIPRYSPALLVVRSPLSTTTADAEEECRQFLEEPEVGGNPVTLDFSSKGRSKGYSRRYSANYDQIFSSSPQEPAVAAPAEEKRRCDSKGQ